MMSACHEPSERSSLVVPARDYPTGQDSKSMEARRSTIYAWSVASIVLLLLAGLVIGYSEKTKIHFKTGTNVRAPEIAPIQLADPIDPPSTRSKYKRVQGMGFQIYTGGAPAFLNSTTRGKRDLNPECVGHSSYGQIVGDVAPQLQCYVGYDDASKDVKERIKVMTAAVEKAYDASDTDDGETLKVFVAPEFYWRGVNGAYRFHDEGHDNPTVCGPVCQVLQALEKLVAQKRFEDWLFVFGTIVASGALPSQDPYDYEFYNFAPLYKGYDPHKMDFRGKRFLVPKRYVSSSDFLTPQRHLNSTVFKELIDEPLPEHDTTVHNPFDFNKKRYGHSVWKKYKEELNALGYAMIEYDWIMIDGIALTVEICFDHQMRTALNSYIGDIVTGRTTRIPASRDNNLDYVEIPQYQAQVSVVSSAGMTITPDSLALTDGGVIFLQDGLSNEANRMFWGVDGCDQGLQFEGGTEAVTRKAYLSATDVVFEHKALQSFRKVDVYDNWKSALNGTFSSEVHAPQIVVYDTVDIAVVR